MVSPQLSRAVAQARTDDLVRRAARRSPPAGLLAGAAPSAAEEAPVTLRLAGPDDAAALRRLAELDSASPVAGPVLVGIVAGRLVAALALADDRVIADPFQPTLAVVELLRARAAQLVGGRRRGGVRRALAARGFARGSRRATA